MLVTKPIDLPLLTRQLTAAGVPFNGLGMSGTKPETGDEQDLHTFDGSMLPTDLPPSAQPVVDAHIAPPPLVDYAGETTVHAIVRTTDATAKEVFRFPCDQKRLYTATLTITGIDAGSFASKIMEGRFTWKRVAAPPVMVGIVVVSDIHDAAAAAWAPNALPSGNDIVFTVAGAAGRTIDWLLAGTVGAFVPQVA
jgi:hypothetical protein